MLTVDRKGKAGRKDAALYIRQIQAKKKSGCARKQRTLSKRKKNQNTNFRPNCIDRAD